MELSDVKNVTVNVDSATAEHIARMYLHFKYFEQITTVIFFLALVVVGFFIIRKFIQDTDL